MSKPVFFKRIGTLTTFLMLYASHALAAAPLNQTVLTQMDEHFSHLTQSNPNEQAAVGYVILIADHDKIIHQAAVGYQNRDKNIAMSLDTRFRIASMTKPIVATVIMQLIEEHKLKLDDPISNVLPEYAHLRVIEGFNEDQTPRTHEATHTITIRQLLAHTSGLGYAIGANPGTSQGQALLKIGAPIDQSLSEFSQKLSGIPLYFEPGQGWRYSYSYDVLGALIEKITHQSLEEALQARVFKPLQMSHTRFHALPEDQALLATVYRHTADGQMVESTNPLLALAITPHAWSSGGGGLISTAEDYRHFATMLLEKGSWHGHRLLHANSVAEMLKVQVDTKAYQQYWGVSGLGQSYGLGLGMVVDAKAVPWPTQNGEFSWGGALDTHWIALPQRHIVALLLAQVDPTTNTKPQLTDVEFHQWFYRALNP